MADNREAVAENQGPILVDEGLQAATQLILQAGGDGALAEFVQASPDEAPARFALGLEAQREGRHAERLRRRPGEPRPD